MHLFCTWLEMHVQFEELGIGLHTLGRQSSRVRVPYSGHQARKQGDGSVGEWDREESYTPKSTKRVNVPHLEVGVRPESRQGLMWTHLLSWQSGTYPWTYL